MPKSPAETPDTTADASHHRAIRDSVDQFLVRHSSIKRVRDQRGISPGYDRAIWRAMAELGWVGLLIPEEFGGMGLGLPEAVVIAEALAYKLLPEPFCAASIMAVSAILGGDSPGLHDSLLPAIAAGDLICALAWQEAPNAFDPLVSATTARRNGSDGILSGTKRFITGGNDPDGLIVSATGDDGLALYWVPRETSGLTLSGEVLVDGTFHTIAQLNDVRVPRTGLLASPAKAAAALTRATDLGTIVIAAEMLGVARAALDLTLEHLRTRQQFGKPIGSYQALQHRAVDCAAQVELAAAVLQEAVDAQTTPHAPDHRQATISRAKARCHEAVALMSREAIQMHGAMGFTDECDVGLYVKRGFVLSATMGNAHWHRRRFARLAPPDTTNIKAEPTALSLPPPETDWNALSDAKFRSILRGFIEQYYPSDLRYLPRRVHWNEVRDWNLKLAAQGWIAPAWPRAQGGMELSPTKQLIYIEEFERWGVGRAPDQGVRQLGPVLIKFGTEQQKAEYLPKILSCEHIWCQGYSEPNAGSDLASVSTSGTVDGDHVVINGSKIWTSMAMDSSHIYVLCRTDRSLPKHQGLSFVITEMNAPGVSFRPIRNIAGDDEFCQVFFDDVRVPIGNVIGGLNRGWNVAKAVLGYERLGVASPNRPMNALNRLTAFAKAAGLFDDAGFVDDYTRHRLNLLDHATLYAKYASAVARGEELGDEVSYLKIWGMEALQRLTEFAIECSGAHGALPGPFTIGEATIDLMAPFYMARPTTIGGGTSEVQRNLIARRLLNLPR